MRAPIFPIFHFFLAVFAVGLVSVPAWADADPPGRVARINYTEGAVSFAPAGDDEFVDADINRPLVRGDKLWADKGVRAEIQAGSAVVRMGWRTQMTLLALDDQTTQLSLTQGTLYLRVRNLPEGENFEVDTPNLAWRASYPGDFRIDVDRERGVTRVTIHSGIGAVFGEKAETLPMGGGQQITFKGRALAQVDSKDQAPQDNFDRWAAERNRRDDQSVAARYIPRDAVGYALLDPVGEWKQDATLGVVWVPQSVPANWVPYRSGRWEWMEPWGWTWIDELPWAFVTSHYGRWAMLNSKWAWVPGRMSARPIYSPALVAFVGGASGPLAIGGKQSVAWFPLAPGEAWQPGFHATQLYISSVNANMTPQPPARYQFQSAPEALTAIALDDFAHGKPAKGSWLNVAANTLGTAQVVPPPAMPEHTKPAMTAHAAQPPRDNNIQPAMDNHVAPAKQHADARKLVQAEQERAQLERAQQERMQLEERAKAEQARAAEIAKAAQQAKPAEPTKVVQQAKTPEPAKVVQQAKATGAAATAPRSKPVEPAKVAQQKKQVEQQKLALQRDQQQRDLREQQRAAEQQQFAQRERERAEQARRDVVAKRTEKAKRDQAIAKREQAKREVVAKRAQDAKRYAEAKKQDEAQRVAHAQQLDLARRAAEHDAQVLASQRVEREASIRRVAEERERERAQREAWQKPQRPDLHRIPSQTEPEVWQRSIPQIAPGPTS